MPPASAPACKRHASREDALAAIEAAGIVVLTLTAVAIGMMQVGLRYIFNAGIPWSESVSP